MTLHTTMFLQALFVRAGVLPPVNAAKVADYRWHNDWRRYVLFSVPTETVLFIDDAKVCGYDWNSGAEPRLGFHQ